MLFVKYVPLSPPLHACPVGQRGRSCPATLGERRGMVCVPRVPLMIPSFNPLCSRGSRATLVTCEVHSIRAQIIQPHHHTWLLTSTGKRTAVRRGSRQSPHESNFPTVVLFFSPPISDTRKSLLNPPLRREIIRMRSPGRALRFSKYPPSAHSDS